MKKMIKIITLIFKNFSRKKYLFGVWKAEKTNIKNYFFCYLIQSSIIIEFLSKFKVFGKMPIKIIFTDGLKMLVPIDKRNELNGFIYMYQKYLDGYKQKLGDELILNNGDVVIDIGAHIGTFSVPAFYYNSGIKIYAFEPIPDNFKLLQKNKKLNLGNSDFRIENIAVFGESGIAKFSIGNTSTIGSVAKAGFFKARGNEKQIEVKTATLDDVFSENHIDRCALIKMDCEGSEYSIFQNLSATTLQKIENIIMEVHPTEEHRPMELKSYLEKNEFKVETQYYSNGCYDFFCKRIINNKR